MKSIMTVVNTAMSHWIERQTTTSGFKKDVSDVSISVDPVAGAVGEELSLRVFRRDCKIVKSDY
jgi:hypothetical protein